MRDEFYQRVIGGLQGSLDADLFEHCACDLLRSAYPTLAPIKGGSDSGMDGAIADGLGEPFPLVCTTGTDVLGNLARSLKSYVAHGGQRRKVVLATSHNLTPQRKHNLFRRANELGFQLINIHDQIAMADLLYRSQEWCRDLLGITGNPPALSLVPMTHRPLLSQALVGRDADLEWLRAGKNDRLLVGQPGSGKTFLLYKLARDGLGFFVVDRDRGAIAAAIREMQPTTLIVDDAHTQTELLTALRQMRTELGAEFSILASCWPGERGAVTEILNLPSHSVRELEPLDRDQIVEVIEGAGIGGPDRLVQEIVDQAEGRPGLAVTLRVRKRISSAPACAGLSNPAV